MGRYALLFQKLLDPVEEHTMAFRKSISLAVVSVLTMTSIASPAAADKKDDDAQHTPPVLLSDRDVDWVAGSSAWVSLSWTGFETFRDIRVTVVPESKGLTIEYPENHDGFTSLITDSDLSINEIDLTNFKVTTNSANRGQKSASVYVEYTIDDAAVDVDHDDRIGEGRFRTYMGRLKFSNKKYRGDDFLILTDNVVATSTGDATDNWIEFGYKGLSPLNTDLSIQVSGSDLPIYYPQSTHTSLHHDHVLNAGEADVARIWLDPEMIEPGQESLDVTVSYRNYQGRSRSVTHVVELEIQ